MQQATSKLTYSDYVLLPDDGKRYEIVEGELYMTPAPMTRHQLLVSRLNHLLVAYLEARPIGVAFPAPCDVLLSDHDIVQPDLLVVLEGGTARITEKNVQGPPDLVIEILSPGTAARDRDLKRKRYEHFGVREYWLVDPDLNTVEILRLESGQYRRAGLVEGSGTLTSPLFPGLTLDLRTILR